VSDALLQVSDLTVSFGRKVALDHISLDIEDRGNVVGLFGQNGAGKSTLIRVVCGLIERYRGSVSLSTGSVGYLPDESFLYPFLTVGDSIAFAEDIFDDFDPGVARRIFSQLGLGMDVRIGQASKGMLELAHLGMILARRCKLYVFDEPLAAVDPLTRDRLIEMVRRFRSPGSTVVISTHLIGGLESLFDEAVVIHQGKLVLHNDTATLAAQGGLEQRFKETVASYALEG